MAITLPDFTALPQVTPQAGGSLVQYPQTDPVATGIATLGKGLEAAGGAATDIAAYQDIAKTKMDRATADADFSNRTIPITEQLKVETDPDKITALRGQFQDALNTASQAIGNSDARNYWLKSHAPVVATGQAEADFRNTLVGRDNYNAGTLKQIDDVVRNGAAASDPTALDIARHHIDDLTTSAVSGGYMPAVEAQRLNAKAKSDLVTGRIDQLVARKQYDAASDLLNQYRNDIGPVMAGHFEGRIEKAREDAAVTGGTNHYWGGGSGYGAGGRGSGTPAPANIPPAPAAPEQYKPVIDKAASQYGVPSELLTRVLSAENDFTTREGPVIQSGPYKGQTAKGIAQFLDETAATYGVNVNDTTSSINGAAHYLADLKAQTGSWHGALKSYLGGEPANDVSYTNKGVWQFADHLDGGGAAGSVVQGQGGATRNLPITPTVNAQLEKAATTVGDLKVEVFSGGQPATGENRVGSHRHDQGDAADVQLRDTKTGQLLDMRKPEDRARMQGFITAAVAAGATGVGAAEDYMGPHGIHIGGGEPAAWGKDGSSANAPGWVKSAFDAGRAQARPVQVASAAPTTMTDAQPGAPAPAATPATTAAPAAPAKFDLSAGDSIGLSGITNGGLPGTYATDSTQPVLGADKKPVEGRQAGEAAAVGGRGPQANLDYINAHPEEFRGKTVFWSTGLMNAGKTAEEARPSLPIVEKQLDRLKDLKANVVLVGVDKGAYAPLNRELGAIATAKQVPFAGALPTTNVHPGQQAMQGYVNNATRLIPASAAAPAATPAAAPAQPATPPAGQIEPGNIDLNNRPVVKNPDGSISTVRSMCIEEDGKQVLIPTVAADGSRILTDEEAIKQYHDTGQQLGKFDTVANANAAAEALHQAQAQQYAPPATAPAAATPTPAAPPPNLAPHRDLPAIEQQVLADVGEGPGKLTPREADRIITQLRARAAQEESLLAPGRDALAKRLTDGLSMLANGRPFAYNPDEIRHFFTKDKAEEFIQKLDDARDGGQIISQVKVATPEQLEELRGTLQAGLDKSDSLGYAKRQRLFNIFQEAAKAREVELDKDLVTSKSNVYWGGGPGLGPVTDPAARLAPQKDLDAMTTRAQQDIDAGNLRPDIGARIITELRKRFNDVQAAEHNDRITVEKEANNGATALASGKNFDYDPAVYRHYFPADQAERIIQGLEDSKQFGQFTSVVANAAPDQIRAMHDYLAEQTLDPAATDATRRQHLFEAYNKVVANRDEQLAKDAGGYVQANSPLVIQKWNDYKASTQSGAMPPNLDANQAAQYHAQKFADFAQATLAEQERLGVRENLRTILSKDQAAKIASNIAAIDVNQKDPVPELQILARGFGAGTGSTDYWPQVFGELVTNGKLPGPYQILATMDRPDQAVAAHDLGAALTLISKKGGMAAVKEAAPAETKKALDQALETELQDFRLSTAGQSGGQALYDRVEDSARALAYYYGYQGQGQSEAVKRAVDGIVRNKYDFGTLGTSTNEVRVPRGTLYDTERAADVVRGSVMPDQLGPVPVRDPTLARQITPDQAKVIWAEAIKNGGWVNNRDDSGIILTGKFRDGAEMPVTRADGTPYELKFDDVPKIANSLPMAAPIAPAAPF